MGGAGRARALAILALAAALPAAGAGTAMAQPSEVGTVLTARVLAEPRPVTGADGRMHLAYEVELVNRSPLLVRLDSVRVLSGASGGRVMATIRGKRLTSTLRIEGFERGSRETGTTIFPSHSATLFVDVALPRGARVPRVLRHRFDTTNRRRATPEDDHRGRPLPAGSGITRTIAFTGARTPVARRRAIAVGPPLRGARWVVANGCCATVTSHRGATNAINGIVYVAERFAIDFVQLDPAMRMFTGPVDLLSSYAFFGEPILSVADGVVVGTQDGLPEQTPGRLPGGITLETAGGNYVVVRIAPRRYAFYAHLQPGSLRVRRGDRVRRGQVLGLLGNSGNTDAPHLHFHVMDGPSPLGSDGMPYVFDAFTGEGVVTDEGPLFAGDPTPVAAGRLAGPHRNQLPLNDQLVAFP